MILLPHNHFSDDAVDMNTRYPKDVLMTTITFPVLSPEESFMDIPIKIYNREKDEIIEAVLKPYLTKPAILVNDFLLFETKSMICKCKLTGIAHQVIYDWPERYRFLYADC